VWAGVRGLTAAGANDRTRRGRPASLGRVSDSAVERTADPDSAAWLRELGGTGPGHEAAVARLHALLLRVSRAELSRRSTRVPGIRPELDDLAHQAAGDATVTILAKLGTFRGESRFTTWAYKFAVFEVSGAVGRLVRRGGGVSLEPEQWERLPDRLGPGPADRAEAAELAAAVRRAVDEELTEHQRRVFVAVVVNAVPLDALVVELDTNRNAVYKTVFDARRKIRQYLVAHGYLDEGR
jgi:RNA polymerase sigma-70 factor (ECF subfamily)